MVRVSGPDAVAVVARCFAADDGSELDRHAACDSLFPGEFGSNCGTLPLPFPIRESSISVPCDLFLVADGSQLHAAAGGGVAHDWFAARFGGGVVGSRARPERDWRSRASSRCGRFWPGESI